MSIQDDRYYGLIFGACSHPLLGHLTTADERLTAPRLTGVLINIAGVATTIGPQAILGAAGALLPSLAIVCAAVSYAGSAIFARRFKGQPPLITSAAQLSVCLRFRPD